MPATITKTSSQYPHLINRCIGIILSLLIMWYLKAPIFFVLTTWFFLMLVLESITQRRYSPLIEWFSLIFIFLSNYLGAELGFYDKIHRWDELLHFSYGFAFTFIGYRIILASLEKSHMQKNTWIIISYAFFCSVAIWALWEIYEYQMDVRFWDYFTAHGITWMQEDKWSWEDRITDTMQDLILETTSALICCILLYTYLRLGKLKRFAELPLFRNESQPKN